MLFSHASSIRTLAFGAGGLMASNAKIKNTKIQKFVISFINRTLLHPDNKQGTTQSKTEYQCIQVITNTGNLHKGNAQ